VSDGQSAKRVQTRIDLRRLKAFALDRLPAGSSLRDVLLSEESEMPADEFIHKLSVWLKLLRRDARGTTHIERR